MRAKYTKSQVLGDLVTGTALLKKGIKELPTLLHPILPEKGLVALVGSSDIGKSIFLYQLCSAIATGQKHFLGYELRAKHNRTLYFSTEDNDYDVCFKFGRYCESVGLEPNKLVQTFFCFNYDEIYQRLKICLTESEFDLIVIDTYSDVFGENLNDTHLVRTFMNPIQQLANEAGCLILLLHHTGKRTDDKPPHKSNILGAQGFESKTRLVMELRKDFMEPHIRHLCIVKGNHLPEEFKCTSIALEFDGEKMLFTPVPNKNKPFSEMGKPETAAPSYSQDDIKLALELKQQGKSLRDIEKETGVPKSTISYLLKKMN